MGFEREKDLTIARECMEAVDILPLARRPITTVSGGERQRVILARALAQETPVLLLDEPASHLDLRHQVDVYRLLEKRKEEQGTTIVLVSHDLNLPARHCDRIIALKDGQVAAEGSPREVITEENIRRIFGARMKVLDDGAPVVVPAPGDEG
jgi:iron complex transport system ATP-binding protein